MFSLNSQGFDRLNIGNIILLPKKANAMRVTDFRPINLIHRIIKIFAKLLVNRLAPLLDSLVSKCQGTFVKKQSIHDNFLCPKHGAHVLETEVASHHPKARHTQSFWHSQLAIPFGGVVGDRLQTMLAWVGVDPFLHHLIERAVKWPIGGPVFSHRGSVRVTLSHRCCSYSLWIHYNDYWTWQHNTTYSPL